MKKVFSLLFIPALILALCVSVAEQLVGLPNPIVECASLEEVNARTGCRLMHPGVMGVTDQAYLIINCEDCVIGEYLFSVNGMRFSFRCCGSAVFDISGAYIGGEAAFADTPEAEIEYAFDDPLMLARWFTPDGQYCLAFLGDEAISKALFENIVDEMMFLTADVITFDERAALFAALAGEYADCWSERAMATVSDNGDGSACISIHWGSSAAEYTGWEMTVRLGEDGLLYYTDCVKTDYFTSANGDETASVLYTNGTGFFSLADGVLYWDGAEDADCLLCTFEILARH